MLISTGDLIKNKLKKKRIKKKRKCYNNYIMCKRKIGS